MNVFVLDKNPELAAQYHINRHVVKMIVESAQVLSTACRLNGVNDLQLYKVTHKHHPCTIIATNNRDNYIWTLFLMKALCKEYTYRFGKVHASERLIKPLTLYSTVIPQAEKIEFAQAMPCKYKRVSPVSAYRSYYQDCKMYDKNNKYMGFWTRREIPAWITNNENLKILTNS